MFSQCQERSFFCTFYAVCPIGKSSTSKCKFQDLPLLALKFTKFLMSFLEPRISFCSNFASLFGVMRHNSSVLFRLNVCMLWTNGSNQSANFWTFEWLGEDSPNFSCHSYLKPQVSFSLNFASLFDAMGDKSSVLF